MASTTPPSFLSSQPDTTLPSPLAKRGSIISIVCLIHPIPLYNKQSINQSINHSFIASPSNHQWEISSLHPSLHETNSLGVLPITRLPRRSPLSSSLLSSMNREQRSRQQFTRRRVQDSSVIRRKEVSISHITHDLLLVFLLFIRCSVISLFLFLISSIITPSTICRGRTRSVYQPLFSKRHLWCNPSKREMLFSSSR